MTTHLIGIGGAGMSGIARVFAQRGEAVTGCDRARSLLLDELARDGSLVTFGIAPLRPETGFGYIECGDALGSAEPAAFAVRRFVEKPPLYYWSVAGLFALTGGPSATAARAVSATSAGRAVLGA